ncbi:MAG TPA: Gfo/Idh/MocA family oxidoreductase [Planctomycetaceae bacterium]|nr:Gfo/Idh/MocA family oxidoreductase [Planctomycetaceae bacterium]
MARQQNRRKFLAETAAIGVGAWVAGPNLAAMARSPNEQLNIACIGVGGKGSGDTDHAGQFGNIVALCDIDDRRLDGKSEKFPQAKKFHDFRRMLEEMEKSIDAVTVSTPDHTHAAASMMAIRLKKHVYTQKPLTWSVAEARALREAAHKYGVCTQMGNQGQSLDGSRTSIEIIRSGVLGDVHTVHVWTDRCGRFWKQAPDVVARPMDQPAVPPFVHWDLFLGPAPERPYHPAYHPFAWRGWRDFGTGALGDMACHVSNMAFLALNLQYPTSISAENSEVNPETFQQWATITFEFPAGKGHGPVKFVWWEGVRDGNRNLPPAELFHGEKIEENGLLLIGSKGTLYSPNAYGATYKLLPTATFEGYKPPEPTLPRFGDDNNSDSNQKKEWIAAIRAGKPELALSNFGYAGLLTEAMLLGNVAIRAGKKIEWDGAAMKIPNAPEAQQFLSREYRRGWTL